MRETGKGLRPLGSGPVKRRAYRAAVTLLAVVLLASPALLAAGVRFWTDEGDGFRQGAHSGTVLSADGWLTLAGKRGTLLEPSPTRFVWDLATDSRGTVYVATGNQGKLLRLRRDPASGGDTVDEFYDFTDPVIFSLACDAQDNVYAATSPGGTVYKLVPRAEGGPEVSVSFDAEDPYIWDMAVGKRGQLYLATGPQGRIYKVEPDGTGSLLYDSPDPHVLCLALAPDDTLYAGTNEHGWVYRFSPDGSFRVAYDAAEGEIHAMVTDKAGNLYFGTADLGREAKPAEQARAAQALVVDLMRGEGVQPSLLAPPSVIIPGEEVAATNGLYRLTPAGEVVQLGRFKGLLVLSLTRAGDALYLGTGNQGRLFLLDASDRLSEVEPRAKADSPPPFGRQITALAAGAAGEAPPAAEGRPRVYLGTANPGGLLALEPGFGPQGTFTSQAFDARSVARWGQVSLEGELPARTAVQLRTRSGQTDKPDETWSDWTALADILPGARGGDGTPVGSPPARFLQYELRLATDSVQVTPTITQVRVAYVPSNQPPRIQGLAVGRAPQAQPQPQPPAQPQPTPAERPGTGQEPPAPASPPAQQPPSPRVPPGVVPLFWSVSDPDGDQLTFTLYFRGEGETLWKLIAKDLTGTNHNWQTDAVPDGTYYVKLVVSDAPSNPGDRALSAERVTSAFIVDNTPPRISDLQCERTGGDYQLRARVTDETSPIASLAYSIDAKEWVSVEPADGIFDQRQEEVSVGIGKLDPGEHTVTLKAGDSRGNTAAGKQVVVVPQEGGGN